MRRWKPLPLIENLVRLAAIPLPSYFGLKETFSFAETTTTIAPLRQSPPPETTRALSSPNPFVDDQPPVAEPAHPEVVLLPPGLPMTGLPLSSFRLA